jgi:hypothetical protein
MRLGKVLRRFTPNPHAAARDVILKQSSNLGCHAVSVCIPIPTCMAQELTLSDIVKAAPDALGLWPQGGEGSTPVGLMS